ncbi:MAG: tRNA threonylcarbamoyladenosine dehydratase, partial [Treponema sp.]|nr:tRNA threonylcarbamoyladenosine dehydratase [Treponema sp.]
MSQFERTELLIGTNSVEKLKKMKVAVFGIGGVGSYVVEALARCGIGSFDLIDKDVVSESNINRQIIALHSTVGIAKVEVAKKRILDINPCAIVNTYETFFLPENAKEFDFVQYDYVIDAVDTVSAKIEIIRKAKEANVPVISCMGTGNKLNPLEFKIADISKTSVCPLARVMRKEL